MADGALPLAGLSILIVDDIPDARDLFTELLRQAGAVTTAVDSAESATRRLEHVWHDVVLTDLAMPGRDGFWLLKWIRERDAKHNTYTPIIAVTAHDDRYDTGDLRFDSCRVKPVPWSTLLHDILVVTARAVPTSA